MKKLLNILLAGLMAAFFGCVIYAVSGSPHIGAGFGAASFASYFVVKLPMGSLAMATVQQRQLAKGVETALFAQGNFYLKAKTQDKIAIGNIVDTTTQTGKPKVINLSDAPRPLTVTPATQDNKSYERYWLGTEPDSLGPDKIEYINPDLLKELVKTHSDALMEDVKSRIMHGWGPDGADFIVRTSGTTNHAAGAPSATGNRKDATEEDILAVKTKFDKLHVSKKGRYGILPADLYNPLLKLETFISRERMDKAVVPEGVIGKIYGIWIIDEEFFNVYDNTGTPVKKAFGAAGAATDNMAGLFFQEDMVRYHLTPVKSFWDQPEAKNPDNIVRSELYTGSAIKLLDGTGVISLVEAAV